MGSGRSSRRGPGMRVGWRKGRWGRGGEQKCAFSMEGTGSSIGLRAASSKEFGKGGRGLLVRVHFFFLFFPSTTRSQCKRPKTKATAYGGYRGRLEMGGGSAESARRSLRRGASPSTLAVAASGKERRLAAKDRAAAKASSADHRRESADVTVARVATGAARARDRASSRTNSAACGDHRPPTSMPRLTTRHRLPCASSG